MPSATPQPKIQDYAMIGDCRSAALVSRTGSIDWLCWPRFDSPSLFGALLDPDGGGSFRITPAGGHTARRRYLPETNVLETLFRTSSGSVILLDFMPVAAEEEKRRRLDPDHSLLRIVKGVQGEVELEVRYDPRPRYGTSSAALVSHGPFGLWIDTGGKGTLALRSSIPLAMGPEGRSGWGETKAPDGSGSPASEGWSGPGAGAIVRVRQGEVLHFQLSYTEEAPAVFPPFEEAVEALQRSVDWWRSWVSGLRYDGPYREHVIRSALALRMMIYAPSGAVVAAPTTSLPEEIGGSKNWDYRFCWLRDASFIVRALFGLGFHDEAASFVSWLLHTTRLTRPRLNVLYDVFGEEPPKERELPMQGYRGSRPVRLGNAAKDQLQLDVYGEVIDAVAQYINQGGTLDKETSRMLIAFGRYVCDHWEDPDEGIWEVRSGACPHVHSRVLCWTALDRLIELRRKGHIRSAPEQRFVEVRQKIRDNVLRHGWSEKIQSFVQVVGTDHVDAALLLFPWYGFEKATSERMRKTFERIHLELHAGGSLYYRYATHRGKEEGAFGICSFWAAEYLARGGGSLDEARAAFEGLLRTGSEVGLFSEEVDPRTGDALGNFPQGFTHVGLINAALAISERMRGIQEVEHHVLPQRPEGKRRGRSLPGTP